MPRMQQLNEVLDDTPVYVATGGARSKKGRRDGTLEYSESHCKLMVKAGDKLESIEDFVKSQLGPRDRSALALASARPCSVLHSVLCIAFCSCCAA